jgi:hypothetical protein
VNPVRSIGSSNAESKEGIEAIIALVLLITPGLFQRNGRESGSESSVRNEGANLRGARNGGNPHHLLLRDIMALLISLSLRL